MWCFKNKCFIAITLVVFGVLFFVMVFLKNRTSQKELRVQFPISLLRQDDLLLDPFNTQFTYQYYLLENLTVGLVRDDTTEPTLYRPVLAESWAKKDDNTWTFNLRNNLKWSDDSPITGEQVVQNFQRLKESNSRHIVHLKFLNNVTFDKTNGALVFSFSKKMNEGLLHELSLADAALLHPSNLTKGWNITSGPYIVEKYNPENKIVSLKTNRNCPLTSESSPKKIFLFGVQKTEDKTKLFSEIKTDLVTIPSMSFWSTAQKMIQNAPITYRGFANEIYFFKFNEKNPLTRDEKARREFASIVRSVFKEYSINPFITHENQFIPVGYEGRLLDYVPQEVPIEHLRGKHLKISLHPNFKELPDLLESFTQKARQKGVDLEIIFTAYTPEEKKDESYFAMLSIFKGNQRDALGSWSFLFGDSLKPFAKEAQNYFEIAVSSQKQEERDVALRQLHKITLDKAFGVPFLIEASGYCTSKNIDLSLWNPFDMRMRLYDIRWK